MKKQNKILSNMQGIKDNQQPPKEQIQSIIDTFSSGQKKEAIIKIDALIEKYPLAPLLLNISGSFYKSNSQLDVAVIKFNQALDQSQTIQKFITILGLHFESLVKLMKLLKAIRVPLVLKTNIQMHTIILVTHF